tara:strand:+ start:95269 stop:96108 length:840 start_codon:yes stop_codon:yes gene_type:complete
MKKDLPYQLICSDIDGTLLDVNRDISEETLAVFKKLNGHLPILLASSRMPSAMHYLQKKLNIEGAPLIAYNGGLILGENGTVIESNSFSLGVLKTVISNRNSGSFGYNISIYSNDDWFTETEDYWTKREINNTRVKPTLSSLEKTSDYLSKNGQNPHKIMCMGDENEIDALVEELSQKHKQDVNLYRSKNTYLEITARNIDKSLALKVLLDQYYHISIEKVIAFGDNHNDVEMLQQVGLGVAMANATENVKSIAGKVSLYTNKEHAVAKAIDQWLLGEL